MLHLACHGVLQAGAAATSYLLLAGGSRLSAGEVIEVMGRAPDRAVGLVVLAACRTGRAINSYDEAYSLGTAFLAGGARTVLSTQWSIPDGATSVLMFMTHYFLMARGMPARQALREAQLWMLDRDREPPASMPADLTAQLDETDPAEVMAWAGFIHGGQ
jgi:CHAT domain-containing protein